MQTTTNYGLKKPDLTDYVNIQDFNDNADVIDQQLKAVTDAETAHLADNVRHITATERDNWNSKETPTGAQAKIDAAVSNLAGAGRTTETVKGNADAIASHIAEATIQLATGTANAIVVTTDGKFTYTQFRKISFKSIADNTGNVTLNVDGKGIVPFRRDASTELSAGGIKAGKVYDAYYDTTNSCFFLLARASGNAVAGDLLANKTASTDNGDIIGTMPNKVGANIIITPSTSDIVIPQGYFGGALTDGKVLGDPDLVQANILTGKTIFNVAGNAINGAGMKHVASGTATASASGVTRNYKEIDGSTLTYRYLAVPSLTFKPELIFAYNTTSDSTSQNDRSASIFVSSAMAPYTYWASAGGQAFVFRITNTSDSAGNYTGLTMVDNTDVFTGGFYMPVNVLSSSYDSFSWVAYG